MNKRDDFSQKTIDRLCERVGGKCSNPNCRRETKGPHSNPQKRVSIGEAAHITAAAEGGPRYNPDLTPEVLTRKMILILTWLVLEKEHTAEYMCLLLMISTSSKLEITVLLRRMLHLC